MVFSTPPVLKFATSGGRSAQTSPFLKYTPTSLTGPSAVLATEAAAGAWTGAAAAAGAEAPDVIFSIIAAMTLSLTPAPLRAIKSSGADVYFAGCDLIVL